MALLIQQQPQNLRRLPPFTCSCVLSGYRVGGSNTTIVASPFNVSLVQGIFHLSVGDQGLQNHLVWNLGTLHANVSLQGPNISLGLPQ